jgi:peptidoglycan/xylan/chitin deacetylase (PgdA/CDA1 family)
MSDAGSRDAGSRDAGSPDAGTVTKERTLQLTFDDGPDPVKSALDPILKEVAARKVKAAFFVLGNEVPTNHSAIARIGAAGYVIGNHSWDHLPKGAQNYTDDEIYEQFAKTHAEVKKAGPAMEYFRAPRGQYAPRIEKILTSAGPSRTPLYSTHHCYWQADSRDSQKGVSSAEAMLRSIEQDFASADIAPLRIGGVRIWRLLFHVKPATASALTEVLDELQRRGGKFVDFSQD